MGRRSCPGMASSIPSLVSGGPSSKCQIPAAKGGRNLFLQHDLSAMTRWIALGGRKDPEGGHYPLKYGRMRAVYWIECVLTRSWKRSTFLVSCDITALILHLPVVQCPRLASDISVLIANHIDGKQLPPFHLSPCEQDIANNASYANIKSLHFSACHWGEHLGPPCRRTFTVGA